MKPPQFFYRMTDDIRITVRVYYLRDKSNQMSPEFVFVYQVRIENVGNQSAQLRSCRWLIHDEAAGDTVVEREGVLGKQPHIPPGHVHQYCSFCALKGPSGWMEGEYRLVRDDGSCFQAVIPRSILSAEPHIDSIN